MNLNSNKIFSSNNGFKIISNNMKFSLKINLN